MPTSYFDEYMAAREEIFYLKLKVASLLEEKREKEKSLSKLRDALGRFIQKKRMEMSRERCRFP